MQTECLQKIAYKNKNAGYVFITKFRNFGMYKLHVLHHSG